MSAAPVTISLEDLSSGNILFSTLEEAFGPDSLGIIIVKDIKSEFVELRHRLLSYSSYLGNLPACQLEKLENPRAKYLTGWSLGKETLKNGQVDALKGSFYANCSFYVDPTLSRATPAAKFSPESHPEYLSSNLWPPNELLPGFLETFEELCRLIINTAVLVARACDSYAEKRIAGYTPGYLQHVVQSSTTTKARLLHYFPNPATVAGEPNGINGDLMDDNWCATHIDHGCLTGLTSAMFVDETCSPSIVPASSSGLPKYLPNLPELPCSPDPKAGLYIQSRTGKIVQVKIPKDCIAFQTGEALEKITKGRFKAVPHFVKGVRPGYSGSYVARNTLVVFTQPNLEELVDTDKGITFAEFARGVVEKNTTN